MASWWRKCFIWSSRFRKVQIFFSQIVCSAPLFNVVLIFCLSNYQRRRDSHLIDPSGSRTSHCFIPLLWHLICLKLYRLQSSKWTVEEDGACWGLEIWGCSLWNWAFLGLILEVNITFFHSNTTHVAVGSSVVVANISSITVTISLNSSLWGLLSLQGPARVTKIQNFSLACRF